MKKLLYGLLLTSMIIIAIACSKEAGESSDPEVTNRSEPIENTEPVTLTLYNNGSLTEETY